MDINGEKLPEITSRNIRRNISNLNDISKYYINTSQYSNLNTSQKIENIPSLKHHYNNGSSANLNININKRIDTNVYSPENKLKKIIDKSWSKKKKKKDEYLQYRKLKILKLEKIEAQKIQKINERNEEYKKLNDDEKKILFDFEKEKMKYIEEISNIRKKIKEMLNNYEKIKSEKETELENLNIEITKIKLKLVSIQGINLLIENLNKEKLTYEDIIKDICNYGIFIKNEIYKFNPNENKINNNNFKAIENNHNLEILLDTLNKTGINDKLKENYKDKNLPNIFLKFLLLDNFIGEKSSFKFNLSKFKCEEIKNVLEEQIKFSNYIKTLINSNFKIPKEKIIINNFRGEENEMMCDIPYFS